MANVLIQPSFGNAQARSNYAATLENPISFMTGALRDALSEDEFKELYRLHPDGTARFWATPANHDKKMDKLALGDVVLFTGGGRVRAIGEVGASFRNADAGDAMWPPAEKHGSYQNVYSLITFGEAEIPYEVLRKLTAKPNSSGGDNYMGARLLEGHWAERVIDGLLIDTRTEVTAFAEDDVWVGGVAVEDEAHSTGRAEWSAPERQFVASRRESELVVSFREHLTSSGDPRSQKRLKSAVGFSDFVSGPHRSWRRPRDRRSEEQFVARDGATGGRPTVGLRRPCAAAPVETDCFVPFGSFGPRYRLAGAPRDRLCLPGNRRIHQNHCPR